MANVIYADSETAMSALFGRQSNALQDMLQTNVQRFSDYVGPSANGIVDRVKSRFHDYTHGYIARQVENIRNTINYAWQSDVVRPLETLSDVQHAPSAMRRFIMAEPQTRALYHQQRCEGYGEDYVDAQPGKRGVKHYDYRVATNGVIMSEKDDNDETQYVVRQFFERESEAYTLTLREKASIQHTWATIRQSMEDEVLDHTSVQNALLG